MYFQIALYAGNPQFASEYKANNMLKKKDIVVLLFQYAIVIATIWRYVYNELYGGSRRACMYGGLLIDTHESFIWKFLHCPNQLYGPAVVRDYVNIKKKNVALKQFVHHRYSLGPSSRSNKNYPDDQDVLYSLR